MTSKQTKLSGLIAIAIALLTPIQAQLDGNPNTIPDWNTAANVIVLGYGLFVARQNTVTSEDVLAPKK